MEVMLISIVKATHPYLTLQKSILTKSETLANFKLGHTHAQARIRTITITDNDKSHLLTGKSRVAWTT